MGKTIPMVLNYQDKNGEEWKWLKRMEDVIKGLICSIGHIKPF